MIDDGPLTTGLKNYEEFFQTFVSLVGEAQNFDGNGSYVRIQAGGANPVQTPSVGPGGPLHASASQQPLGTRPAKSARAPYKPSVKCHTQPPANLSDASIGGGP